VPRVSVPRDVLETLLAGFRGMPTELRVAGRHGALPLMTDFMGCWALTMSGQLAFIPHDAPEGLELVTDRPHPAEATGIRVALAVGSRRYPALASIQPVRPADAVACAACDGTGRLPGWPENLLCACGGLGWLPRDAGGAA
jgi:hypothetical protein